ncbi:MAG: hypothetical protein U0350_06915 [Caldilineaceae bacterium]
MTAKQNCQISVWNNTYLAVAQFVYCKTDYPVLYAKQHKKRRSLSVGRAPYAKNPVLVLLCLFSDSAGLSRQLCFGGF